MKHQFIRRSRIFPYLVLNHKIIFFLRNLREIKKENGREREREDGGELKEKVPMLW